MCVCPLRCENATLHQPVTGRSPLTQRGRGPAGSALIGERGNVTSVTANPIGGLAVSHLVGQLKNEGGSSVTAQIENT